MSKIIMDTNVLRYLYEGNEMARGLEKDLLEKKGGDFFGEIELGISFYSYLEIISQIEEIDGLIKFIQKNGIEILGIELAYLYTNDKSGAWSKEILNPSYIKENKNEIEELKYAMEFMMFVRFVVLTSIVLDDVLNIKKGYAFKARENFNKFKEKYQESKTEAKKFILLLYKEIVMDRLTIRNQEIIFLNNNRREIEQKIESVVGSLTIFEKLDWAVDSYTKRRLKILLASRFKEGEEPKFKKNDLFDSLILGLHRMYDDSYFLTKDKGMKKIDLEDGEVKVIEYNGHEYLKYKKHN